MMGRECFMGHGGEGLIWLFPRGRRWGGTVNSLYYRSVVAFSLSFANVALLSSGVYPAWAICYVCSPMRGVGCVIRGHVI